MVDWIEKEVEVPILEIDPCFIDPLKRLSRILNFEQLSFSRRYGAVCIMYIATGSFKYWKYRATIVVEHGVTNLHGHRSNVT